ncbi:MAG: hypothetical protein GX996_04955 [Firmicutes bacterium]|nr:hypothetical protein [Bacillota bacterium]
MDQLQLLWQFQELEQEINRQKQNLQKIPSIHEHRQEKEKFTHFQQMLKEKEEDLNSLKRELRRKELELQTITASLKEMDKKLYSGEVRNVKELENLEKNVQTKKKEISDLEDEIIHMMEKSEQDAAEISRLKKTEEEKSKTLQQLMVKARNDLAKAQENLEQLNDKHGELLQTIDESLLNRYRELSKRTPGGRCISLVKKGFCGICNVSLPSSFKGYLLTPGKLVYCENCGSLLVYGD